MDNRSKAKARWGILRTALLGRTKSRTNHITDNSNASIHRFAGFQLLTRKKLEDTDSCFEEPCGDHDCFQYSMEIMDPLKSHCKQIHILTRERLKLADTDGKIDIKDLTSERHYGVDATGQRRVWDSELILTHSLLSTNSSSNASRLLGLPNILSLATSTTSLESSSPQKILRVIELGSGMAGISGLALAAANLSGLLNNISVNVTLTDGHPKAVQSNKICASLTSAFYSNQSNATNIQSHTLLWTDTPEGIQQCNDLTNNSLTPFQLCLASDCLHFQEFHSSLAVTIGRLLGVGGVCLLCQPPRGNSMQNFLMLLDEMNEDGKVPPLWNIRVLEDYNDRVNEMHRKFVISKECHYDPNIHLPKLVILKKLRDYQEEIDTTNAILHMNER